LWHLEGAYVCSGIGEWAFTLWVECWSVTVSMSPRSVICWDISSALTWAVAASLDLSTPSVEA
jgi:hypothetical protein